MITQTKTHYQICAEMTGDIYFQVPSGVILWLGRFAENLPGWTQRDNATCFLTKQSAIDYFNNGRGYTTGIYKPIFSTVRVCEQTILTMTSETFESIKPAGDRSPDSPENDRPEDRSDDPNSDNA
jgi:hypothetical protein